MPHGHLFFAHVQADAAPLHAAAAAEPCARDRTELLHARSQSQEIAPIAARPVADGADGVRRRADSRADGPKWMIGWWVRARDACAEESIGKVRRR